MGYRVRLHPSGREFFVEPQETLLEAGLRSGVNFHYNCSNGSCGECRARIIEGRGEDREFHDYALSESERNNGMVLLCTTHATSDLLLEARIVGSAADIPHQQISVKIARVEQLSSSVVMLLLRTPRTQTLRFLAGQHVALHAAGYNIDLPIASCPCNGMMLQFHLQLERDEPLATWLLLHARVNDHVQIEGPFGNFLLREESPHAVVMVSEDTGFAPLKALIEHYINLEKPQPIHLYRMAHQEDGLYLSKLCDSWRDALDNFTYTPIIVPPGTTQISVLKRIADEISDPAATDLYLAFHEETSTAALQLFTQRGVPQQQISLHHSRMLHMKALPDVASH